MKSYGSFLAIMALLCVSVAFAASGEKRKYNAPVVENKRERRVLFDEDIKWATSRTATDAIVERVAKAGFNVYIPCVWHGRGAIFTTRFAHIEPMVAARVKSADDPLDYLLKQAHSRGIEVHPWFTVALRLDDRHSEFFSGETPPDSYDVHNAKFRGFMKDLIVDVVRRYPVDGINLDYIRSAGTCECPTCTAGYERRFHRSLHRDAQAARDPAARVPSIEAWHGEAVSEIVRDVSFAVRSIKPGIVISVDGYPLARWLLLQGQDSALWERNGWIDVIFGMEYRRDIGLEDAEQGRRALADPAGFTILEITYDLVDRKKVRPEEQWRVNGYEGNQAVLSREPETLAGYVRLSRERWPGTGIAFYHYKQLTDAHITALRKTVFKELVPPAWPKAVARARAR